MPRRLATLVLLMALWPSSAPADRPYEPTQAGHPLRIAAYALHPVGYALDRLLFWPAWSLGQIEPFRTVFGVERRFESAESVKKPGDPEVGPAS